MKIIEVHNSKIAAFLKYNITLYPFILYIGTPNKRTIKHEWIHIGQIKELGFFRFYLTYFGYYLRFRLKGMNSYQAYRSIPYEIEAYSKEGL